MTKSRNFSIYLLKNGFSHTNALKEDNGLIIIENSNTNLPPNSVMYIADSRGSDPWWKSYWGLTRDLFQVQKGAIVFLPVENRWVVLTFGMTYHKLKDNCYEYDFGLRTTLNALDPQKIKSTDILEPESAKRQRIQTPTASSLSFFDIRQDESIIKKLTGAVKSEFTDLFKNATGASNLHILSKLPSDQITDLCETIIKIYDREDYKNSFPDILNIVPVKDPDTINQLNEKLLQAFDDAPEDLVLSIPEIIDFSNSFKIKYTGAGHSNLEYEDVYIGAYRAYIQEKNIDSIDIDMFNKHKMVIVNEDGKTVKEHSIYKSFLFDCEIEGGNYHLCEGEWYFIETDYIQKLSDFINPYFANHHNILHECDKIREDDYNISVQDANSGVFCLDKKNIAPSGQRQVEPCDLLYNENNELNLVHVKISTRSASLSHLFNQGVNSVELLRMEIDSRDKLKSLVNNESDSCGLIDQSKFRVTYGIITNKASANSDNRAKNLPIFSRISLQRALNALKVMNIPCTIYLIQDRITRRSE